MSTFLTLLGWYLVGNLVVFMAALIWFKWWCYKNKDK
jgi:hypothetical protein